MHDKDTRHEKQRKEGKHAVLGAVILQRLGEKMKKARV